MQRLHQELSYMSLSLSQNGATKLVINFETWIKKEIKKEKSLNI